MKEKEYNGKGKLKTLELSRREETLLEIVFETYPLIFEHLEAMERRTARLEKRIKRIKRGGKRK